MVSGVSGFCCRLRYLGWEWECEEDEDEDDDDDDDDDADDEDEKEEEVNLFFDSFKSSNFSFLLSHFSMFMINDILYLIQHKKL